VRLSRVFVSYSHKNEAEKDELLTYLAPLVGSERIETWHDRQIQAGEAWESTLHREIETADVALLVVTVDFLASRYCTEVELPAFFEGRARRGLQIVPILFSSCLWRAHPWLSKLQFLPRDARPVDLWPNRAQVLTAVCKEIERLVAKGAIGTGGGMLPSPEAGPGARPQEPKKAKEDHPGVVGQPIEPLENEVRADEQVLRKNGELRAGDVLGGRYQLWECLGEGGFATVWCARDLEQQEKVAVRVLRTSVDGERRTRFFRGAEEQARLHHPGVARVLVPAGEDRGIHYMVMEYLEGGDLGEAVLTGRIRGLEAVPLLVAVGKALDYSHDNDLIHRDVKPTNILLDQAGKAHLTDFDLVRAGDTTGDTRTGMMGTFLYAAPEAFEQPGAVTRAADVFSLGMTALFCLHGKALPVAAFKRPATFIAELPVGNQLKRVLKKAVREKAEERYKSCGNFCAALAVAADQGRGWSGVSRSLMAMGIVALVVAVLLGGKWPRWKGDTGTTLDAGQVDLKPAMPISDQAEPPAPPKCWDERNLHLRGFVVSCPCPQGQVRDIVTTGGRCCKVGWTWSASSKRCVDPKAS
jgi:hypothetical protein